MQSYPLKGKQVQDVGIGGGHVQNPNSKSAFDPITNPGSY